MNSIYLTPHQQLQLAFEALEVEPGPAAHRLSLRFQATPKGLFDGGVALITGELRLDIGGWIGPLHADAPLPISATAAYPRPLTLSTTISDHQLASIESGRSGADLELRTDLQLIVLAADSRTSLKGTSQGTMRVAAATWAQQAQRLGALVTVPLLVPLPLGDPDSRRAKAGLRLQAALRAITDGQPEEAVRQARLALELHRQVTPATSSLKSARPRDRDLPARFANLDEAVQSLASGAHHEDEVTATFVYTRTDAIAIVACVAALMQRP